MTDHPSPPPTGRRRLRSLVLATAKVAITAGLIAWLAGSIDFSLVWRRLVDVNGLWLAVVAALTAVQVGLLVGRWLLVVRFAIPDFGWREALHNLMTGLFFNQVLPSGVGGDAMRAWLLTRGRDHVWRQAVTVLLADRIIGLIALVLLAGAMTPVFLAGHAGDRSPGTDLVAGAIGLLVAGVAAGYLFLALVRRLPRWLAGRTPLGDSYQMLRRALAGSPAAVAPMLLSLVAHATLLLSIAAAARAFGIEVSLAAIMVLTPPAMVVATLPLSIAGWGLRETGFVAVLGLVGVSATDSALLGLTVGLTQVLQGMAGGLVWIGGRGVTGKPAQP